MNAFVWQCMHVFVLLALAAPTVSLHGLCRDRPGGHIITHQRSMYVDVDAPSSHGSHNAARMARRHNQCMHEWRRLVGGRPCAIMPSGIVRELQEAAAVLADRVPHGSDRQSVLQGMADALRRRLSAVTLSDADAAAAVKATAPQS